jgi:hypothetical protein
MILTNKQAHILIAILQDTLTKNKMDNLRFSHKFRNDLLNEIINQQGDNLEQSENTSKITEVFEICNAYESGFGHGYQMDNLINPFKPDSKLYEAYDIGYQEGEERKKEDLKDKQEDNISIFAELKSNIHQNHNSNFHFESLNWNTRIWIKKLCDIIDERLDNKKKIISN